MGEEGLIAGLMAVLAGMILVLMIPIVIMIIAMWKIFTKAGKPGWAALIPIYNTIVLLDIVGKPTWWIILMFIPLVSLVVAIIMLIELCKSFGKDGGFMVGMILLCPIFMCILGFGSAQYLGPGGTGQQPAFQPQTPMPPQA